MRTLLFVYNANSGPFNSLFDAGHKLLSPKTYNCNLCALTHHTFTENKTWKAFREQVNIDMKFYHIDEFVKDYPVTSYDYPVILIEDSGILDTLLSSSEINNITTVEELISYIEKHYMMTI